MTTTFHTSWASNTYCNADMLSRLPIEVGPTNVPVPGDAIMLLETLQSSPVTVKFIKTWITVVKSTR